MAFAQKMKMNNVRRRGVQVFTHFLPTFGRAMESRMNSTTASRAFMSPVGIGRSCFRKPRTAVITTTSTKAATNHSISTCLVTEKSIPAMVGR